MQKPVWLYPERTFEQLGAVRYQVTWEEVRESAMDKDDIDIDADIIYRFANYKTKAAAIKKAKEVINNPRIAFGAANVTKQVVDWYVEEDKIAEWVNCGESEEVSH